MPLLTYAYNTQVHGATGCTPFELVLSRPPTLVALENTPTEDGHPDHRLERQRFLDQLKRLTSKASANLAKRQARYKADYDKRIRPVKKDIEPGQFVFVQRETPRRDQTEGRRIRNKLQAKADGPYKVVKSDKHTVTFMRDNLLERVSWDRIYKAPTPRGEASQASTAAAGEETQSQDAQVDAPASQPTLAQPSTGRDDNISPAPTQSQDLRDASQDRPLADETPPGGGTESQNDAHANEWLTLTTARPVRQVQYQDRESRPEDLETSPPATTEESDSPPGNVAVDMDPPAPRSFARFRRKGPTVQPHDGDAGQEFPVDKIMSYDPASDSFRTRWTGYTAEHDTDEPSTNLPYNMVARFFNNKGNLCLRICGTLAIIASRNFEIIA